MVFSRVPSSLPIPIPDEGVLLVGGTFDPPHLAHIDLPCRARAAQCPRAALVFVPAARSPHKSVGPSASDADRIEMLERAIEGTERACVWTDEIDRASAGEASYWVETVRRARSLLGGRPLRFVIGSDQAVAFHRWRESSAILEHAEPVVLLREPWGTPDVLRLGIAEAGSWSDAEVQCLAGSAVAVGTMDVSATEIRGLLRSDRKNARLESMLAPGVLEFIRDRGLYLADQ